MPYHAEHSCRLRNPETMTILGSREREHNGKSYRILFGVLKHGTTSGSVEQAYRYPITTWTEGEARAHCKSHNGILFEPAIPADVEMATQKLKNALKRR